MANCQPGTSKVPPPTLPTHKPEGYAQALDYIYNNPQRFITSPSYYQQKQAQQPQYSPGCHDFYSSDSSHGSPAPGARPRLAPVPATPGCHSFYSASDSSEDSGPPRPPPVPASFKPACRSSPPGPRTPPQQAINPGRSPSPTPLSMFSSSGSSGGEPSAGNADAGKLMTSAEIYEDPLAFMDEAERRQFWKDILDYQKKRKKVMLGCAFLPTSREVKACMSPAATPAATSAGGYCPPAQQSGKAPGQEAWDDMYAETDKNAYESSVPFEPFKEATRNAERLRKKRCKALAMKKKLDKKYPPVGTPSPDPCGQERQKFSGRMDRHVDLDLPTTTQTKYGVRDRMKYGLMDRKRCD